jgi:D-alanine-D-alanine ligase
MLLAQNELTLVPVDADGARYVIDVVFPVFHGEPGEDGSIQGLCSFFEIPYVGPTVRGAAVALDKAMSKALVGVHGIGVPRYLVADVESAQFDIVWRALGVPFVVKPKTAGSSLGVSFVGGELEFANALEIAARFDRKCLIEEFVEAIEVHCYVLGVGSTTIASLISGKVPLGNIYSHAEKINPPPSMRRMVAADFETDVVRRVQEQSRKVFGILDGRGFARVDFFLCADGTLLFNEINTIPGLRWNPAYGSYNSWANHGIELRDAVDRLIRHAIETVGDGKDIVYQRQSDGFEPTRHIERRMHIDLENRSTVLDGNVHAAER